MPEKEVLFGDLNRLLFSSSFGGRGGWFTILAFWETGARQFLPPYGALFEVWRLVGKGGVTQVARKLLHLFILSD